MVNDLLPLAPHQATSPAYSTAIMILSLGACKGVGDARDREPHRFNRRKRAFKGHQPVHRRGRDAHALRRERLREDLPYHGDHGPRPIQGRVGQDPFQGRGHYASAGQRAGEQGHRDNVPAPPDDTRTQGEADARDHRAGRPGPVSYTHLRAHETRHDLVCRLLLEKKKKKKKKKRQKIEKRKKKKKKKKKKKEQ